MFSAVYQMSITALALPLVISLILYSPCASLISLWLLFPPICLCVGVACFLLYSGSPSTHRQTVAQLQWWSEHVSLVQ